MYIEARSAGDTRAETEIARAVRAALRAVEPRLQRILVQVEPRQGEHFCWLRAWSARGQTIVIERRAGSRQAAVESAADSLKRALERRLAAETGRWPTLRGGPAESRAEEALSSRGPGSEGPRSARPESVRLVSVGRRGSPPEAPDSFGAGPRKATAGGGDASAAQGAAESVERGASSAPRRARILLLLQSLDAGEASVSWAQSLADALDAELDVCRVLGDLPRPSSLPPGQSWLDATRKLLAASRETRAWCGEALPDATLWDRALPGAVESVEDLAQLARGRGVGWIVLPAAGERPGELATALARAAGCPVLVARAPTSRCTLLVATEADENNDPALRRAARLAAALQAPVLAFHDVSVPSSRPSFVPQVTLLAERWKEIQNEAVQAGSDQRLPGLEVLLAHGSDRVEAILQQARREDAEMVIVSSPPGVGRQSFAASVVERAVRSVLVVPTEAAEAAAQA